jgi:acetyltransferase-like isoleucine patch superfamily enzyme
MNLHNFHILSYIRPFFIRSNLLREYITKNEYLVYSGVIFDEKPIIEPYVIIGYPFSKNKKIKTRIGVDAHIRSHSTIYAGNIIGSGFRTGHGVLIRENNHIGNYVSVGSSSILEHDIIIGNHIRIHSNVFIPEYTTLKDGCWIGPCSTLTNAKYPHSPETKKRLIGPTIGEMAIIGANVTILPGVEIGKKALIGAGAVVTHDIEPEDVAVGNPAHVIGTINDYPSYKINNSMEP